MLGAAAGLILLEFVFRAVATPSGGRPLAAGREIRWFREGFATSHFSSEGVRLTGNPALPGAEVGLILGDSHVEAFQVPDEQTMGSVLERRLRERGRAVNVMQAGVSGASTPRYLQRAEELLQRWKPAWTVIVLPRDDLGREPLVKTPRMEIAADLSVRVVAMPAPSATPLDRALSRVRQLATRSSTLAAVTVTRYRELLKAFDGGRAARAEGLPPGELALVPRATVRALAHAFGQNTVIVYLPTVGAVGNDAPDEEETALLGACSAENIRCVSLRDDFLAERTAKQRLSRGFANSPPGVGHLNETGHRLVACAIARALESL